jgi:hypothetical protein
MTDLSSLGEGIYSPLYPASTKPLPTRIVSLEKDLRATLAALARMRKHQESPMMLRASGLHLQHLIWQYQQTKKNLERLEKRREKKWKSAAVTSDPVPAVLTSPTTETTEPASTAAPEELPEVPHIGSLPNPIQLQDSLEQLLDPEGIAAFFS